MAGEVYAPFTAEQVEALNAYQKLTFAHPYTCGRCLGKLVAETSGWRCRTPGCTYTQKWAHAFTADKAHHPKRPFPKYRKI